MSRSRSESQFEKKNSEIGPLHVVMMEKCQLPLKGIIYKQAYPKRRNVGILLSIEGYMNPIKLKSCSNVYEWFLKVRNPRVFPSRQNFIFFSKFGAIHVHNEN